jgi:hypothetical protein
MKKARAQAAAIAYSKAGRSRKTRIMGGKH